MGRRTGLDSDICSSSSIWGSDWGSPGPQRPAQHPLLQMKMKVREESPRLVLLQAWGSCLSQKFTRADHWSSSKLRNGEAHCFSSVGGIARLGSGDTGGHGTLEQQTLQLQLLTYMHPVHQEQKASPSTESWCPHGGGQHPALHGDCFTWVTWHPLTPVTLSLVHPLVSLPIFLWNSYKPKLFLDSFWDTCYDQNKLTGSLWEAWESSPVHHHFMTTGRVCPNMHGSKLNMRGFILNASSLLHSLFPAF